MGLKRTGFFINPQEENDPIPGPFSDRVFVANQKHGHSEIVPLVTAVPLGRNEVPTRPSFRIFDVRI